MNQELLTYLRMPKIRLLASIKIDSKKDYEIKKKTRDNWIKNEKCSCCNHPLIKSGKIVLTCEHIQMEWKKKTKEIEKRINNKTKILLLKSLSEAYNLTKIS